MHTWHVYTHARNAGMHLTRIHALNVSMHVLLYKHYASTEKHGRTQTWLSVGIFDRDCTYCDRDCGRDRDSDSSNYREDVTVTRVWLCRLKILVCTWPVDINTRSWSGISVTYARRRFLKSRIRSVCSCLWGGLYVMCMYSITSWPVEKFCT